MGPSPLSILVPRAIPTTRSNTQRKVGPGATPSYRLSRSERDSNAGFTELAHAESAALEKYWIQAATARRSVMDQAINRSSWFLGFSGAAAVIFGIVALVWPSITLVILVALFAAYALVAGIFTVVAGLDMASE